MAVQMDFLPQKHFLDPPILLLSPLHYYKGPFIISIQSPLF
jgi:hypothetical protein